MSRATFLPRPGGHRRAGRAAEADPAVDIATLAAEIVWPESAPIRTSSKSSATPISQRRPARTLFHPRHRAVRRRPALSPHRPLRLPSRRARPVREALPLPARTAGKARAIARPRSGNAHRCDPRRQRAAGRRHPRRPGSCARDPCGITTMRRRKRPA